MTSMDLKIFDVEHGGCALLTCDDNTRLMIDAGHNGSTNWRPGAYLRQQNISNLEMLAVTNYDEDHVSGIGDLFDNVNVNWLWRNTSVATTVLKKLKSDTGMGPGIDRLCNAIDKVFTGDGVATPQPTFAGLKRTAFYNDYPNFDDENNLSMAILLECHGTGALFTGDLEKSGWLKLLENSSFRAALSRVNVLMASHHGRESGCCEEAMKLCTNLFYVVISDKGYQYDTQYTNAFYSRFAKGGPFRGQTRKVLTTRNDGRIGFEFRADGWAPY